MSRTTSPERTNPSRACSRCGAPCLPHRSVCSSCSEAGVSAIQPGGQHAARTPIAGRLADDDTAGLLAPGAEVGNYRIEQVLGVGGIGEVYLADHVKLGRKVALKKLRSEYSASRDVVSRFFDEARAANQIAHENIVEITDFVEDPRDGAYLIMELLRGEDLGMVLERDVAIPPERIIAIMRQVASALAAAHRAGIVHRDLKPDNVFLTERSGQADFVKVLDFGVAKLGDDVRVRSGHTTAAGTVLGTPAYMSPEQALGRPVDLRTDIYAFGVILYELLTGALPFAGETLGEFVVAHATEEPRPPSSIERLPQPIPTRLEELIMRCLAKDPTLRPASMEHIEAELAAIGADGFGPTAYAPRALPAPAKKARRPWAAIALAGIFFVGLGAAGAAWALWPSAAPPAPVAERAAPDPVPAPAPVPAPIPEGVEAPATVTITFTSEPPGAEVWREGAPARLGVTPFSTPLPRAEAPMVFELRLEGYETLRQEVALVADAQTSAALSPVPRREARREPTAPATETSPPVRRPRPEDPGRRGVLEF